MICTEDCLHFLSKSKQHENTGLCGSPEYIVLHESCFTEMGSSCEYCKPLLFEERQEERQANRQPVESPSVALETQDNKRRSSRERIFVALATGNTDDSKKNEPIGVVIDISATGMALVLLKDTARAMLRTGELQEFDAVLRIGNEEQIFLHCEFRRLEETANFVQLGVAFSEPLSEELQERLLKPSL